MAVKHGENLLPRIFLGRTVERREDKHGYLGAHAYAEQGAASGQVQDFEQCSPDDDGRAYGVREVEETLSLGAVQEPLYAVAEFPYLSHYGYCD